jgi:hypothetical protein
VSPPEPLIPWYEQVERTLLRWRIGRRQSRRYLRSSHRQIYIHAIARTLTRLQRYTTMEALVTVYARTDSVPRLVPLPEDVSRGVVKDVSFWLRLQQLLKQREKAH